ncbi:cation efflux system protein CusF [Intestinirhabdus alba]|jgi:Cu(I)/Ag(I) efflux system protein CusF|uniref:Cation efflux system protein CusF n=1 Tax=Intestinirhabdus alba TaxID=2899544 RepID=A0A6L6IJC1_9ENTR|nr:cation efflux system protein CusF [Intestinirhabdus alba]MTH44813.1 cation efflux system protein CusF [Intestinirhabdus alba]
MHTVIKAAVFSVCSLALFNARANEAHGEAMSEAAQAQAIAATGVIEGIDRASNKVTIAHDPIPALGWPAMVMRFTLTPQTAAGEIKPGDKVAFHFIQQGALSLLQDIQVSR